MATITLRISDEDLTDEGFKVDFIAEGDEINEGQATAAYFTGYYLHTLINEPSFTEMAIEYGREIVGVMLDESGNSLPLPSVPAVAELVLTDEDINTGRYAAGVSFVDGDATGTTQPTSAMVIAMFMRSLIGRMDFIEDCHNFARDFIADRDGASIANDQFLTALRAEQAA